MAGVEQQIGLQKYYGGKNKLYQLKKTVKSISLVNTKLLSLLHHQIGILCPSVELQCWCIGVMLSNLDVNAHEEMGRVFLTSWIQTICTLISTVTDLTCTDQRLHDSIGMMDVVRCVHRPLFP